VAGLVFLTLVLVVVFDMTSENAAVVASQEENMIGVVKMAVVDNTSNHDREEDVVVGVEVVDNVSNEEIKGKEEKEAEDDPLLDPDFLLRLSMPSNFTFPTIPADNGGCFPPSSVCEFTLTAYPTERPANETYKITQRGPLRPRRHAVCNLQVQGNYLHFPHVMQQVTRCFSFFQEFSHLRRQYIVRRSHQRFRDPFNQGLWDILQNIFNVVITSHLDHVVNNHTVLAHPLYDTGYFEGLFQGIAFQNVFHAETLRTRTADFYNLTLVGCPSKHTSTNKTQPVIRILNRVKESNRSLSNAQALQAALEEMTQSTVDVVYFENKTFLEQVSFMMETDILISPHGAQLTSINFMPACGAVVEAFPQGFWFPHFFGPLAASAGLTHGYIYTGKNHHKEWKQALRHRKYRFKVRKQNICLPLEQSLPFIEQFVDNWRQCCHDRILAGRELMF